MGESTMLEKTAKLRENLMGLKSESDVREFYENRAKSQEELWKKKINEIVSEAKKVRGIKKIEFADLCGVTLGPLNNWLGHKERISVPKNREKYIQIGFAADYDLKQMNEFLQKIALVYGIYYENSWEDCVYHYALSCTPKKTYKQCQELIKSLPKKERFDLSECVDEDFKEWAEGKQPKGFEKLYEKLLEYINKNLKNEVYCKTLKVDTYVEGSSYWQQVISEIRNRKWIPKRKELIDIAVMFNCTLEELNDLLKEAKMCSLYPRLSDEALVMYILKKQEKEQGIWKTGSPEVYDELKKIRRKMLLQHKLLIIDVDQARIKMLQDKKRYTLARGKEYVGDEYIQVKCPAISSKHGYFTKYKEFGWAYRNSRKAKNSLLYFSKKKNAFLEFDDRRLGDLKLGNKEYKLPKGICLGCGISCDEDSQNGLLALYLYDWKNELKQVELKNDSYIVGSCPEDCDIVVNDQIFPSKFFEIKKEGEKFSLIDKEGNKTDLREKQVLTNSGYHFIYSNGKLIYNDYPEVLYLD